MKLKNRAAAAAVSSFLYRVGQTFFFVIFSSTTRVVHFNFSFYGFYDSVLNFHSHKKHLEIIIVLKYIILGYISEKPVDIVRNIL